MYVQIYLCTCFYLDFVKFATQSVTQKVELLLKSKTADFISFPLLLNVQKNEQENILTFLSTCSRKMKMNASLFMHIYSRSALIFKEKLNTKRHII